MLDNLIEMLHSGAHSLVVENRGKIATFDSKGVRDLYALLTSDPDFLQGANIADKVVGKGAAALMILGKINSVHADVISSAALSLFSGTGIKVSYERLTPNIINRKGDGICPVETLCLPCDTAQQCLPLISRFISEMSSR